MRTISCRTVTLWGADAGRDEDHFARLATMMVAVSDNSATNVLIDRVGMENVNAFLTLAGFDATQAARKDDGFESGGGGAREHLHSKEMVSLLQSHLPAQDPQ